MTVTITPACCGMAGCNNPVENPEENKVVIPVTDDSEIVLPCCGECRNRLSAPSAFNFYGMN